MTSKSLPTSDFRTVSTSSLTGSNENINNSSSLSSSVKKSSPLTKPWFNPAEAVLNYSSTNSDKSWMTHRWSTVSGSLIVRRKQQRAMAYRLWLNRHKRRTYPPSSNILRQEQRKFGVQGVGEALPPFKKAQRRQSLVDILNNFHKNSGSESSSSSLSKKLGRILKRKGKQPYHQKVPPELHIDTREEELKDAVAVFQPPPTISSKSSTPSTPIKFPTPPKRFSAVYVDYSGKKGKSDYKRPKEKRSQQFLNLIHHGVAYKLSDMSVIKESTLDPDEKKYNHIDDMIQQQQQQQPAYCMNKYNTQLSIDSTLFLFGFIFFPFWWVGAWLYFRRRRRQFEQQLYYDNDLFSLRVISYLNAIFSFLSLVFLVVIISLVIWLVKSS